MEQATGKLSLHEKYQKHNNNNNKNSKAEPSSALWFTDFQNKISFTLPFVHLFARWKE